MIISENKNVNVTTKMAPNSFVVRKANDLKAEGIANHWELAKQIWENELLIMTEKVLTEGMHRLPPRNRKLAATNIAKQILLNKTN